MSEEPTLAKKRMFKPSNHANRRKKPLSRLYSSVLAPYSHLRELSS
ncbi:hypothetical protein OZ806_002688 [Yersinia enterocolitica]